MSKTPSVLTLGQLDGGTDPMSTKTRACKHVELKPSEGAVGPNENWSYVTVKGWRCTECGSGFASPRAINAAMKKAGWRGERWPSNAVVGNEGSQDWKLA